MIFNRRFPVIDRTDFRDKFYANIRGKVPAFARLEYALLVSEIYTHYHMIFLRDTCQQPMSTNAESTHWAGMCRVRELL